MKELRGKTALVTGAAMGLGKALARMLAAEGCNLALVDVDEKALQATREELASAAAAHPGLRVHAYGCDIADREHVYALAARVRDQCGQVTLAVNNAGVMRAAPLLALDDIAVEKMISINLTAQFWVAKAFLPQMLAAGEGHLVNVASAGGLLAIPSLSAYCASKFGVVGFSEALRQEAKRFAWPVTVTCVCPNTVGTGMFDGANMAAGTRMLDPERVCRKILRGIKKNRPYVYVPSVAVGFLTPLTKVLLPAAAMDRLNQLLGLWTANDATVGRRSHAGKE